MTTFTSSELPTLHPVLKLLSRLQRSQLLLYNSSIITPTVLLPLFS
jgi:hypothetical protein